MSLGEKIEALQSSSNKDVLSEIRIFSQFRLMNTSSHGTERDLNHLDEVTIESVKDLVKFTLEFIRLADRGHYDVLERKCLKNGR